MTLLWVLLKKAFNQSLGSVEAEDVVVVAKLEELEVIQPFTLTLNLHSKVGEPALLDSQMKY